MKNHAVKAAATALQAVIIVPSHKSHSGPPTRTRIILLGSCTAEPYS